MDAPVIEEISPDEQPGPFDAELDRLLSSSRNDPYKVLTVTFEFLKRKTAFFERADASKQLARLLRDVKAPAAKPANGQAAAKPSPGPSTSSAVRHGKLQGCEQTLLAASDCLLVHSRPQALQRQAHQHRLGIPQRPMGSHQHQRSAQPVKRTTRTTSPRASVSLHIASSCTACIEHIHGHNKPCISGLQPPLNLCHARQSPCITVA